MRTALRCHHAFETVCVHANGDLVCSIIDGRGDFVLGNVHEESLPAIFGGARYRQLRDLVLSTDDAYCRAIGKGCPLKTIPVPAGEAVGTGSIRFLQIEPTTACDLRCLSCPVRDFDTSLGWRESLRDGGLEFLMWDAPRRLKQRAADVLGWLVPPLRRLEPWQLPRAAALLLRGSIRKGRTGTLSLETVKRVIDEAGPAVERVDFFNYGEPFLYRDLLPALRHIRRALPAADVAISTDGMPVRGPVEDALLQERLLDWLVFSVDGSDAESYARYRIRGRFETALENLARVHEKARGTGVNVVWQYVVFRWNDSDAQLRHALATAERIGVPIWFDFARSTWGRSRRKPAGLEFVVPFLRPHTGLPTW
jgi:pyruvate-formate lyase-activating enzyme